MTYAINDFSDIRSRMLGDDKPKLHLKAPDKCIHCEGKGWFPIWFSSGGANFVPCTFCGNPEAKPCP